MAAVCLYVGIYYLVLYVRRRNEKATLIFALTCFSVVFYDIFCAGLYSATSLAEGVKWQKGQFAGICMLSTSLIWFIKYLIKSRIGIMEKLVTPFYGVMLLVTMTVSNEWTLTVAKPAIKDIRFGHSFITTYYECAPGILFTLIVVVSNFGFVILVYRLIRYARSTSNQNTTPFIFSFLLFFLAAINDTFVSTGVYTSVYLAEYAFMGLILTMSYALLDRFINVQQEVETLNICLENKVKERTQELYTTNEHLKREIAEGKNKEIEITAYREKLQQSQKLEAIGQLAGGVAHDFNNLLGAILGFAGLIRQKVEGNPDLVKHTVSIINASRRAAELTAQLLAFARKGNYVVTVVDTHETIQDVIKLLEHTIDKRIAITQKLGANPSTVMGDNSQLQNAILNLAVNARDAMPNGGNLTFATEVIDMGENNINEVPPGTYLMLSINDTGIGMDKETQKRLFEPFFTTKGVGKGTGLGLASVYGTVKSHHGHINVTSEFGMGSSFNIYLPVVEKPMAAQQQIAQDAPCGTGHILLVDDEPLIRDAASEMLSFLGYTVYVCEDGDKALEYYRERQKEVNLVILDIIMPKMGGYDCFLALASINPKVKVIVASGYSLDGEAERIIEKGALGFIQKPFDCSSLAMAIKKAISC
ncbi:MAG: response regulator [Fibrobacterota bacterium]